MVTNTAGNYDDELMKYLISIIDADHSTLICALVSWVSTNKLVESFHIHPSCTEPSSSPCFKSISICPSIDWNNNFFEPNNYLGVEIVIKKICGDIFNPFLIS